MKATTIHVIFFSLMIFVSNAQMVNNTTEFNRAILREFNGEQIQALIDTNPQRLEKINYYFTESFYAVDIQCVECVVDKNDLLNISLFNILDYETERLNDEENTIIFKEKYLITLISKTDLTNLINGISAFELIYGLPERPFPTWVATLNFDSALVVYKAELMAWSNDFPKQYLKIKNSPNVLKIRFTQFSEMTSEDRNSVLTFPGGYIIVDDEIMNYPQ